MVNTGATIIPYGCPDCDGDLILTNFKEDNIYELQCKICHGTYLVTMVGGNYESE